MENRDLLLIAFLATQIAWHGAIVLKAIHPDERPMLFSSLGVVGIIVFYNLDRIALIAAIVAAIWGFIQMPWYAPVALFVASFLFFRVAIGVMNRWFFEAYRAYFPSAAPILGILLILVSQIMLWTYF